MPDTPASKILNPAVLRFRGLDLEAMTALQMRNIDAMRRMANRMLDSTQEITERQADFLKAGADQMSATFERGNGASDPKAIFERQTKAYRDLFGAFVTHVGELGEITSQCCAGLVHEATENLDHVPMGKSGTESTAKPASAATKTTQAEK